MSRDKDLMYVVHPGDDLWYETPKEHNDKQGWNSWAAGILFVNKEPVKIPCDRGLPRSKPKDWEGEYETEVRSQGHCSAEEVDYRDDGFKYTWRNHRGAVEVPEFGVSIAGIDAHGAAWMQHFSEDDGNSSLGHFHDGKLIKRIRNF